MNPLRLLLAAFACYRLARLVSVDDGPLWVFARLREFTDRIRKREQVLLKARLGPIKVGGFSKTELDQFLARSGPWASLDDGLRCQYCTGFWFAPLCALLAWRGGWLSDTTLAMLGIAGAQAILHGMVRE